MHIQIPSCQHISPYGGNIAEDINPMTPSAHKTKGSNCTKDMRFYPNVSTGKEKDAETGYGYFGARYMDHELTTMWLSVDPLADKYPGISPYAYCVWNPVKLVDPEGKSVEDPPIKRKLEIATAANKHNISQISWGKTSGLYPTKDGNNTLTLYNPETWDNQKLEDLLKASAAIHLIGTERNQHVHKTKCNMNGIEATLATYHLTSNFPEVNPEILNDVNVKSEQQVATPSLGRNQECVKTYGPFYNIGGGDVEKGPVYIHFYREVLIQKSSNN